MADVQIRQTLSVYGDLILGNQQFQGDFSALKFMPDEMIIRQVSFIDGGAHTMNVLVMRCDFIQGDLTTLTLSNQVSTLTNINVENRFLLNNLSLHGLKNFYVYSPFGAALFVNGYYSMVLEFIKYKN